jgi:hypothetical protein
VHAATARCVMSLIAKGMRSLVIRPRGEPLAQQ